MIFQPCSPLPSAILAKCSEIISYGTALNNFNLEAGYGIFWDGGVLEVCSPNISGGEFLDITDSHVGGTFISGGYTGKIYLDGGNPLAGRLAWSGDSGGYIDTEIILGPNLAGQTVTFQFGMGSDNHVGASGWRVDTRLRSQTDCAVLLLRRHRLRRPQPQYHRSPQRQHLRAQARPPLQHRRRRHCWSTYRRGCVYKRMRMSGSAGSLSLGPHRRTF